MQQALLFQAYGDIGNINECRFSLLKYFAVYNNEPPLDTAIIIYTDQPGYFLPYTEFFSGIQLRLIDAEQIKEWKGTDNFVHRVKIKIMQDCFTTFKGSLLYCDTDTYILQSLSPLFKNIASGIFYMHQLEGLLGDGKNKWVDKWDNFLFANTINYNGKTLQYSQDLQIWNAGVIGIDNQYAYLLEDVLQLTDEIYKKFPRHIAEQFAFDYCLQHTNTIRAAEDAIVHYWIIKEFRTILARFFEPYEESIESMIEKAKALDPGMIQKEKMDFLKLDALTRWYRTLRGKKWRIENYASSTGL